MGVIIEFQANDLLAKEFLVMIRVQKMRHHVVALVNLVIHQL